MFQDTTAFSGFAVDDLEQAQTFYGDTLGLQVTADEMGLLTLGLEGGRRPTLIYPKPDFEPATYTILNFAVSDLDAAVEALIGRGVAFERYEGFEQDEKGIARGDDGPPIAWFRDPDANVLSVAQLPRPVDTGR